MIEIIGWISSFCFGLCALPQVIECYKTKTAEGINSAFLYLWLFGEITAILYVLGKHGLDLPLIVNYVLNIGFISIIIYYKRGVK